MLKNTFCHLPKISLSRENELWMDGILTWEDFLDASTLPVGSTVADSAKFKLEECLDAHARKDLSYFAPLLKRELWRAFPDFRDQVLYVDIETTGLDASFDKVTTVCTYDGHALKPYVNGENLDTFPDDVLECGLFVSFNGIQFDVPFLNKFFRDRFDRPHLDLRFVLQSLGYRGGLKRIERALGLDRKGLADVDGYGAVLLWERYETTGDRRALETLLAYNALDVLNLETLMIKAFNLKLETTAFPRSLILEEPALGEGTPFPVSSEMVALAKGSHRY